MMFLRCNVENGAVDSSETVQEASDGQNAYAPLAKLCIIAFRPSVPLQQHPFNLLARAYLQSVYNSMDDDVCHGPAFNVACAAIKGFYSALSKRVGLAKTMFTLDLSKSKSTAKGDTLGPTPAAVEHLLAYLNDVATQPAGPRRKGRLTVMLCSATPTVLQKQTYGVTRFADWRPKVELQCDCTLYILRFTSYLHTYLIGCRPKWPRFSFILILNPRNKPAFHQFRPVSTTLSIITRLHLSLTSSNTTLRINKASSMLPSSISFLSSENSPLCALSSAISNESHTNRIVSANELVKLLNLKRKTLFFISTTVIYLFRPSCITCCLYLLFFSSVIPPIPRIISTIHSTISSFANLLLLPSISHAIQSIQSSNHMFNNQSINTLLLLSHSLQLPVPNNQHHLTQF